MEPVKLQEGQYLSISKKIDREIVVQRSRFIASLRTVKNRDEFDIQMKEIMQQYPKATHYCWAYRFLGNATLEHASDAGEPSGTAGRPILGALKKHALLNIMAIVTRYYGGVKLGVKGLIDAYGGATLLAIEDAGVSICEPYTILKFQCNYDLYNIFLSKLEKHRILQSDIRANFEEIISGEIKLPSSKLASLRPDLNLVSPRPSAFSYTETSLD